MKIVRWFGLVLLLGLLPIAGASRAQDRAASPLVQGLQALDQVAQVQTQPLDVQRLRDQQARLPKSDQNRFAETEETILTPSNSGTHEHVGTTQVWRLRIVAPNAWSLNLGFARFKLTPHAQLALYRPDYQTIQRFTAADNRPFEQLWTPVIAGDQVVLELSAPNTEFGQNLLELTAINRGFSSFGLPKMQRPQTPDSGACNIDVVCPEGDAWRNEIRSVVIYTFKGGYTCTGALISNTAQDFTPYMLTAHHCLSTNGDAQTVVAYWNYESLVCRPNNSAPGAALPPSSLAGATLRATWEDTDFTLLELAAPVPISYQPYWAGWDRSGVVPSSAVAIHHPNGDEKRISFENNQLAITGYSITSTDAGTHWRIIDWDLGTTEPGSSGSPLFDPQHRIVGQLHGGGAACGNNDSDWYGRLAVSWEGGRSAATRLKDWLDPQQTNSLTLNGLNLTSRIFLPLVMR